MFGNLAAQPSDNTINPTDPNDNRFEKIKQLQIIREEIPKLIGKEQQKN